MHVYVVTSDLQNFLANNPNETKKIVQILKTVDYLYIQDLGGECASDYFRDYVIYNVLQTRFSKQKNTYISSNFSKTQLIDKIFIQELKAIVIKNYKPKKMVDMIFEN